MREGRGWDWSAPAKLSREENAGTKGGFNYSPEAVYRPLEGRVLRSDPGSAKNSCDHRVNKVENDERPKA